MADAHLQAKIDESARALRKAIPYRVKTVIVLGPGLGWMRRELGPLRAVAYKDIPHFPVADISGLRKELVLTKGRSKRILMMDGTGPGHEGYSFGKAGFPVMVLREFGVSAMIIFQLE